MMSVVDEMMERKRMCDKREGKEGTEEKNGRGSNCQTQPTNQAGARKKKKKESPMIHIRAVLIVLDGCSEDRLICYSLA